MWSHAVRPSRSQPRSSRDEPDPLTLLIYTSGSTGAPKGAMYPERLVANSWRRSSGQARAGQRRPSIILCFMPMSHGMGQAILFGALGNGGTAYFAAKSDLSTLLEDLALVHPTDLNFVPRIWDMLFQAFKASWTGDLPTDCRQSGAGGRGDGRAARANWSARGSSRR